MRIAVWWQQESWGGVDTYLSALLSAWPAADEFTIFHNAGNQGLARIRDDLPVDMRTVVFPEWSSGAMPRAIQHLMFPLVFHRGVGRARALLAQHGPFDAVIAQNGSYPGGWGALAAIKAAKQEEIRKRMLVIHHAAGRYGLGRGLIEQLIDRDVQAATTDIVAVSRATRETLINVRSFDTERNPIRVIHNGIRVPVVADVDTLLRAKWRCTSEHFVIGMVGRVERYKGHEDVLLGMSEVSEECRDRLRLVIVGAGDESEVDRLRSIAERLGLFQQVVFAGYVPGDPIQLMRQFDLLAMATKDFEGFGLSIAEAMAAGTPVMATTVGAIPEFVTDDIALLVPPESPTDIARALQSAIVDPKATRARAAVAKSHIVDFSAEKMARNYHRLLNL